MLTNITPYQLILTIFFFFAWTRVLSRYLHRTTRLPNFVIWTIVWGLGLYLVYLPNKADFIGHLIGADNGANAIFTIAIIILFYSVYRIYAKIEELAGELYRLAQASSISNARREKSSTKKRTGSQQ